MDTLKRDLEQELSVALEEYNKIKKDNEWFISPIKLPKNLATLLKVTPNTKLCRMEIYQRIHIYLFKQGLLKSNDTFELNTALKKVFDISNSNGPLHLSDLPFILIEK